MLRRLSPVQPESFAFTAANRDWAAAQVSKYPEGRQQSAIIPLLWRAQEQEGWLTRPAIEHCADLLGIPYIRALEVATFYFMFQLQPVGTVAHVQICGTTTCMICGSGDLIAVCRRRIAGSPHTPSPDGRFSWEEVECLGSCTNAPMAQIGKDYYEDLTAEKFEALLDAMAGGQVPVPGPQNGRFSSEAAGGATTLTDRPQAPGGPAENASVTLALQRKDTLKRIEGTEVPIVAPWLRRQPETPPEISDAEAEAASDRAAARGAEAAADADREKVPEQGGTNRPNAAVPGPADAGGAAAGAGAAGSGEPRPEDGPPVDASAVLDESAALKADEDPMTELARAGAVGTGPDAPQDPVGLGGAAMAVPAGAPAWPGVAAEPRGPGLIGDAPAAHLAPAPDTAAPGPSGGVARDPAPGIVGTGADAGPAGHAAPVASPGVRPPALAAARGGTPDDLQRIAGVGPEIEARLNSLGIWHFDQIAAWGEDDLAWIDSRLEGVQGRAGRDGWIAQAAAFAREG